MMTNGEIAYRAFEQALRDQKYATPTWSSLPKQVARAWELAAETLIAIHKNDWEARHYEPSREEAASGKDASNTQRGQRAVPQRSAS